MNTLQQGVPGIKKVVNNTQVPEYIIKQSDRDFQVMILSFCLASINIILALALAVATSSASAVKCGDEITANTVLNADLSCDCSDSEYGCPLIVKGPATLDLKWHKISCYRNQCLRIGKGATVKNGYIDGGIRADGALIKNLFVTRSIDFGIRLLDNCTLHNITTNANYEYGIIIEGGNNNRLYNVTVKNNSEYGIYAYGNNNTFYNITVKDNGIEGILVEGNNNQVTNSYIGRHKDYDGASLMGSNNRFISNIVEDIGNGCLYASGEGTVIKKNTFRRCSGVRFRYGKNSIIADNKLYATSESSISVGRKEDDGSILTDIRISGNRITKSGADGIELYRAQKTVVDGNVIVDSAGNGIVLDSSSSRCIIKGNTVRKCGLAGLRIRGADGNNVTDNKISFCRTGMLAGVGANRNRMINNRASNSTLFDLNDLSANCGSNVWKGNTGKGNVACTQNKQ